MKDTYVRDPTLHMCLFAFMCVCTKGKKLERVGNKIQINQTNSNGYVSFINVLIVEYLSPGCNVTQLKYFLMSIQ